MSEFGLNLIKKFRPCTFKYKAGVEEDKRVHFGLIAQDINNIIPPKHFAVVKEREGHFTVDYWQMVPMLIKAVQELDEKTNELEKRIQVLNEQIEKYERGDQ